MCHNLCAKVSYFKHTWFNVEMDFLEAPSQMLENWCWESEVLKQISNHYESNNPLPDNLINDLIKSKQLTIALRYLRQVNYIRSIYRTVLFILL